MFEFILDFGTIFNVFMTLFYLITIIIFMFCKRGAFGLKREICLKSEEIWHKVHVSAGLATTPFLIISILLIFTKNIWTKLIVGLILSLLVIVVWNIVANIVTKKDVKDLKRKQQKDLEDQIKKESGWR